MPEVFASYDMDYGHTDKVKHRIKLSNETPFKHRPRPIHPQDVDAVRKHLQICWLLELFVNLSLLLPPL